MNKRRTFILTFCPAAAFLLMPLRSSLSAQHARIAQAESEEEVARSAAFRRSRARPHTAL